MNQELVLLVIGLVVAAFVLRPLVRGPSKGKGAARVPVRDPGPAVAASDELAELELDHAMGRVSDADYERWRGAMAVPAAAPVPDEVPEAAPTDATARAEALVRQFRERAPSRCPNCGERPEPDARYCSNCGTALNA